MSFLLLLILALALCTLIGTVLTFQGFRGRPIPGTATCRACRFDLAGLHGAPSCPECGGNLSSPRAIVPRRIRPRFRLWLGLVLTASPLCIAIGALALGASKLNLNPYKPVWLLQAEAEIGTPMRASAALSELTQRLRTGSVSETQFATLISAAMKLRRTPSTVWNRGWSDIIELGRANDKVTDPEWTDYVRYSFVPIDRHRKTMRAGAEAPFEIALHGPQLGNATPAKSQARIRYGIIRATLNGVPFFDRPDLGATATISGVGSSSSGRQIEIPAAVGKGKMNLTCRFVVLDPADERELGSWEQDFTDDVVIVPTDTAIVMAREDAALAPEIRKSLRWQPLTRESDNSTGIMVYAARPPVNVAFDVFARVRSGPNAGRLVPMGVISFEKGSNGGYGISTNNDAPEGDSVDIVLKPSVAAAEQHIELDSIWTGPDIVYEDIKVLPAKP